MSEEDKLLELAEKATPGPWEVSQEPPRWIIQAEGVVGKKAVAFMVGDYVGNEGACGANAAFIAAANPSAIRSLIASKRELERQITACSPETVKALVEGKRAAEARVAELEAAILRAYDKADLFCDLHYEEAHQASFDRDKDAERKSIGTYHQINQVIDAMQPELATVLKSRRAALTKNGVSA